MNKLELLAPAGNELKMKTALAYGADAVYLGVPDFSLRVRINDFDRQNLRRAVKYVHSQSKRVYVTVNIFAHNKHLRPLQAHIKQLKEIGVDALIISDPGVLALVKRVWPRAEIHLSTQANCTNLEAVKFWAQQGVRRIILGREVTLAEIKEIHRAAPLVELEYFIHGAMCMAYSGRCFLSKLFVNRSANLGDCAQPCRWEYETSRYELKTGSHPEALDLMEERHGTYLLNSRDLCLIKHLKELAAAGISSFKIEGRAKSVYYQAVVTGVYRRALTLLEKKTPIKKLNKELNYLFSELNTKLVHRGYTEGFLLGGRADQNISNSHEESNWEFCGQVLEKIPLVIKSTLKHLKLINPLIFQVHNTVRINEEIEIIRPGYDIIKLRPRVMWDAKTGTKINEAHGGGGGQIVILDMPRLSGLNSALMVIRRLIK